MSTKMFQKIYPCLWFDKGQAIEAASLYCSIFDNARIVSSESDLVVTFEICGKKFMGLSGGPMFTVNPSISFFVMCKDIEQTDTTWQKLLGDGAGKVLMPMDKYPWSDRYGWIQDKYNVSWQVMLSSSSKLNDNTPNDTPHREKEEETVQTVFPSMLFTKEVSGRAEEAIQFYMNLFPGSGEGKIKDYTEAGTVKYAEFNISGFDMVAMDGPDPHEFTFNEGVSMVIDCEDQIEIDHYWSSLTANGGTESQCGWLKDKFGVSWQIVPTALPQLLNADHDKACEGRRVMQALLQMKKIIIADLEKAAVAGSGNE
jgi:predicted 3-demethylubiquinone-9 3-methyltransferase (glyoxalase superfamily)